MFRLSLLVATACLCISVTTSSPVDSFVPIVSEDFVLENDGKFHYSYESGDGTKVHEEGDIKAVDKDHAIESVQGGFEYSSPDGQKVAIQYIADENGYQPTGDVIPQIPEHIVKSLAYNAAHPEQEKL